MNNDVAKLEAAAVAGAQSMLDKLAKLPEVCYYPNDRRLLLNTDAPVIAVKRGEQGYYPIYTHLTAGQLNERRKISKAQAEAMMAGSIFGWDVPAADPDTYLNR